MITDKFKQSNWSNGFEASNSVYARKNMEVKHYQGDRASFLESKKQS
jgi:hypothetical protein